jgi:hypothetical protein
MNTIAEPVMQAISVSRFSRVVGAGPGRVAMAAKSSWGRTWMTDLAGQPY